MLLFVMLGGFYIDIMLIAINYVAVVINLFKTMIHDVIVIELQLLSFRMRIEDRRLL